MTMADEPKDGVGPDSPTGDPQHVSDPNDVIEDPSSVDDGLEDEELYDKDGKPLPWANSKRFRKIYAEAKKAREVGAVLAEAGMSQTELRSALGELQQFREAYQEWKTQSDAGNTDADDDAAAVEIKKRERAITARLKELGFLTKEELEEMRQQSTSRATANQVAVSQRGHLVSLLKNEGFITEDMDDDDTDEVLAEWDTKVGRRIGKTRDDVLAFQQGNKSVVTRHFKAALEAGRKRGSLPATKARPKIEDLPRRVGLSATAKSRGAKESEAPQTIREAAAQMFADMSGK
jgi:hypothetical protein